jgi:hypothetical protein
VISSALSLSSALFESLANPRCFIFKRKEHKDDKSADILRGSGEAQLRMAGQVLPAAQGNIRLKMADLKLETHTEVAHFSELYSTEMVTRAPRVSPYRLKFFFAYKRNKANLDPFHLCFTISL